MESLGSVLKEAREKKTCSFEQVARDTNIARRYLEALEEENFSIFPGEPYLLGFLRNYAEYLSLDSAAMIDLYRAMKIQEAPVPVEALLRKPFPVKKLVVAIVVAVVVVGLGLGAMLIVSRVQEPAAITKPEVSEEKARNVWPLDSGYLEKRLFVDDSVAVRFGDTVHDVRVAALTDVVVLESPLGELRIELGQEESLDLNADGHGDLMVFVADLYKNRPDKGVSLRVELVSTDATPISPDSALPITVDAKPAINPDSDVATVAAAASTSAPVSSAQSASQNAIFTSPGTAWPFTLQATFRGYCMFRWEVDRKERDERYFHKAETLTVQARNALRLWVSNAAAVKLTTIGGGRSVDLDIGRAGEVVVVDIKWVRDEDNQYRLVTERID